MESEFENFGVDASDPIVIMVSWGLTLIAGKFMKGDFEKFRRFLPMVAVMSAVAIRSGMAAAQGHELDIHMLARAVGAGAVAVFSHSQFREFQKALEERDKKQDQT
jgi:hypothetical protein